MKIEEMVKDHQNISITVDVSALMEFGDGIASRVVKKMLANLEEKLNTRAEVIKRFDICSATLWRWDKMGLIHGKKIGNRRYYPESEIKRLTSHIGGEENV